MHWRSILCLKENEMCWSSSGGSFEYIVLCQARLAIFYCIAANLPYQLQVWCKYIVFSFTHGRPQRKDLARLLIGKFCFVTQRLLYFNFVFDKQRLKETRLIFNSAVKSQIKDYSSNIAYFSLGTDPKCLLIYPPQSPDFFFKPLCHSSPVQKGFIHWYKSPFALWQNEWALT